jgi:hypothetical protein
MSGDFGCRLARPHGNVNVCVDGIVETAELILV